LDLAPPSPTAPSTISTSSSLSQLLDADNFSATSVLGIFLDGSSVEVDGLLLCSEAEELMGGLLLLSVVSVSFVGTGSEKASFIVC
jgi:hypothetical protein